MVSGWEIEGRSTQHATVGCSHGRWQLDGGGRDEALWLVWPVALCFCWLHVHEKGHLFPTLRSDWLPQEGGWPLGVMQVLGSVCRLEMGWTRDGRGMDEQKPHSVVLCGGWLSGKSA
jgi:hypothetical protein